MHGGTVICLSGRVITMSELSYGYIGVQVKIPLFNVATSSASVLTVGQISSTFFTCLYIVVVVTKVLGLLLRRRPDKDEVPCEPLNCSFMAFNRT